MTQCQKHDLREMLHNEILLLTDQINAKEFTVEHLPDETDVASQITQNSVNIIMKQRHLARMHELETALKRIQVEAYGVCEECDTQISVARLKANPSARLCVVCQSEAEDGLTLCA